MFVQILVLNYIILPSLFEWMNDVIKQAHKQQKG